MAVNEKKTHAMTGVFRSAVFGKAAVAVAVLLSGVGAVRAANIPWTWDDEKEIRTCANSAGGTLRSTFVVENELPLGLMSVLSLFDSRLWTYTDTALSVFSTLPPGGMVIVK